MAKGTRHGTAFMPLYPRHAGIGQTAPLMNVAAATLAAVNDRFIVGGSALWADGATHDLRSIRWRSGSVGLTNGTVTISTRVPDLTAGPVARDDGVVIQSVARANPAASTVFLDTLAADHANVANGMDLCIVFEITALVAGTLRITTLSIDGGGRDARPYVSSVISAVVAGADAVPAITLVASDGTLGYFQGSVPCLTAESVQTGINTGTTPDEKALAYTPTEPHWAGALSLITNPAAGASFDAILYEGTTVKATASIDANTFRVDAVIQCLEQAFADVPLTVGNVYYVVIKPTTANSVIPYILQVTAGDLVVFAKGFGYAERTDGGAWSAVDNTKIPFGFALGIVADDDGAGAGGGGVPSNFGPGPNF